MKVTNFETLSSKVCLKVYRLAVGLILGIEVVALCVIIDFEVLVHYIFIKYI